MLVLVLYLIADYSGHSTADVDLAEKSMEKGAKCITHLFNAMPQFHHRDPGLVGLLGCQENRPFFGIICDGIHVHPNSVRVAYKSHPSGLFLVTDAMAAMGLESGEYNLAGMTVQKEQQRVYLKDTETLAGSCVSMDECVRNFKQFTGCSVVEVLEAATLRPAQVLGIQDRKGTLQPNADADFILLDDDLTVHAVFVGGEKVFSQGF